MATDLPLALSGVVVEGDRRGRLLGFPTANVAVPAEDARRLPPDGVYAASVELPDGTAHLAAVSIGTRPTYYGPQGERLVEAFLLDFSDDLYGKRLELRLEAWVRGQVSFDSSEQLVAQMERDVAAVREMDRRP